MALLEEVCYYYYGRQGRSYFDHKKDKYRQLHILSYQAVFGYVFDNGFLQTTLSALTMYLNF